MGFDSAYEAITEEQDEHRWAFGTGFTDALAGVDTAVPDGVDAAQLAATCLALGDDALIMSHRLQQWLARAPELEEETALANIALDLLGQARLLLARAEAADATLRPSTAPPKLPGEDALAYFRAPEQFANVQLAELDDSHDFTRCVARLLAFSTWRLALAQQLRATADPVLAAICAKAVPELTYHREYAAGWAVRLGDGTALSHERMQAALDWIWPYLDELYDDARFATIAQDVWEESTGVLREVFRAGTLREPPFCAVSGAASGRAGQHTSALAPLLAELQCVAREHAGASW